MSTKKKRVSILHLEDNPDDVELLRLVLNKSNLDYQIEVAENKDEFILLFNDGFDLIISDYNLRNFNGLEAIKEIREKNTLIPIIILSGTVGEELAVDLLRSGANDFVLKSNLNKIVIVIERSLSESEMKKDKLLFQKQLEEKTYILDTIFNNFSNIIFLKNADGKYIKINRAFCELVEMSEEDILGKDDSQIFTKKISDISQEKDELVILTGKPISYEIDVLTTRGNRVILDVIKTPLMSEGILRGIIGECKNITRRKVLLDEAQKSHAILDQAERLTGSGSFEYDSDLDILNCSSNFKQMMNLGIDGATISMRKFANLVKEEDRDLFTEGVYAAIENRTEYIHEHRFELPNSTSKVFQFNVSLKPDYKDASNRRFYGTIVDVTSEYENHIHNMEKQENDRKEIARELHDNLGQKLNAISMFVSKISDDIPENKDLVKVKEIVHESIDDLSLMLSNISVKQVEEHSLGYALNKLMEYLPESMTMESNFNVEEAMLSGFVKSQLYRIVQEVLNNTVKYSEASEVKLDLTQEGSILSLNISDNGRGFDSRSALGNGLQNITHRVRKSNGLINIGSEEGRGTNVSVKMPIN